MAAPPISTGNFQSAPLQFVDDERHLLGGGDQQCRQANRRGVDFGGLADDGLGRNLLAEVDHVIAIVGQDGFDQVLADIVHIAIDGGDHNQSLADAFDFFEVVLEVADGFLHHFGRLQHEGQDQLARAEFVTDFFHGGEQDGIEDFNGADVVLAPFAHHRPFFRQRAGGAAQENQYPLRPLLYGDEQCASAGALRRSCLR